MPSNWQEFRANLIAQEERFANGSLVTYCDPPKDPAASDTQLRVVLCKDPDGPSSGRRLTTRAAASKQTRRTLFAELPGHSEVLREASGWAREALSGSGNQGSHELEVVVEDEDEAAAAKLLIQSIYSREDPAQPLLNANPATILQVLKLAARLQVPSSVRAACRLLCSKGPLPWDAVAAAFTIPSGDPWVTAASRPLRAAAHEALMTELGDLELAWLDGRRRGQLMGLPFEAMRSLLSDGRTRVLTEGTVYLTADSWLHAHGGGTPEQQAALAGCVRAPAVPLSYLTGVMARSRWMSRNVSAGELHGAIAYSLAQPRLREVEPCSGVDVPAPRVASWQLPARPKSVVRRLRMDWDVPLSQLKKLHRSAAKGGPGATADLVAPSGWAFAGLRWTLELQAVCHGGAAADDEEGGEEGHGADDGSIEEEVEEEGISFGLFVTPSPPPLQSEEDDASEDEPPSDAAGAIVTATVTLEAHSAFQKLRCSRRLRFLVGLEARGFFDMFELGVQRDWDEGAWRAAGLVREDGTVRVSAVLKDVQ